MATLYFTPIAKKEIINDYFTSQKSNSQYHQGSFIPFFLQHTQFKFNWSDLCKHFFIYLQSIKYYKHTPKNDNVFGLTSKKKSNGLHGVVTIQNSIVSDVTLVHHSHLGLRK